MGRSWSAQDDVLNRLFRRCLECPPNEQPTCPVCAADEGCALKPQGCNNCASMYCVKFNTIPGQEAPKPSTPLGGIIGGVIAGVVALVVITFLIWRFCIRQKKRQDLWEPPEKAAVGRSDTMLSRTHSIASTVMTRASNVIQIAYIPGITVRSAPESPEIPPPMPSIPSTYAGASTQTTPDVEQHFFMPKDLRDSVWSDTSSMMTTDPRVSIAPSLARASVATAIYQEVPPIPAQYAYRAQANAVDVRSGSTTPSFGQSSGTSPPVPQISKAIHVNGSSIVARTVVARPIEVKKSSSANSVPTLNTIHTKTSSRRATPAPTISDEKEVVISSSASTALSEAPSVVPADGPLGGSAPSGRPTTAYTQAMIHEAMFRATQDTSHSSTNASAQRPDNAKQDLSPFSDANEIK